MADLIAIGLLRALFHQDLALKHANCAVFEHLLEHLSAFAAFSGVGDKDRVVVMKRPVAHRSACDMGLGIGAGKGDHRLVARQGTIGGQGERFKQRLARQMGEDVGDGAATHIAALGADVVEAGGGAQINLDHMVQPCGGGALFQQGQFGPSFQLDHMVQDCIGRLIATKVGDGQRLFRLARHVNKQPISRISRVQRCPRPCNRALPKRFQCAVSGFSPMAIRRIGQPRYCHPR